MATLILIETAASMLSTAIVKDGSIICSLESSEPRSQASLTAPFIKQMLDQSGLKAADCDAVCVSMGPGSYTGLRVGVSTAKGIAFGAGIPLIGIGTLDILARQGMEEGMADGCEFIVPVIDARRMEVYTAVYNSKGQRITEVAPRIIDKDSFAAEVGSGSVLFIGDAADKCREPLQREGARFFQTFPKASAMAGLAAEAYEKKRFEDVAYFEPFYLKDFIATVSRKKLF